MNESADHADFTGFAGFQEFHARSVVGRNTTMEADLNHAVMIPGRFDHRAAFEDGVANGLLNIDVGARFDRS